MVRGEGPSMFSSSHWLRSLPHSISCWSITACQRVSGACLVWRAPVRGESLSTFVATASAKRAEIKGLVAGMFQSPILVGGLVHELCERANDGFAAQIHAFDYRVCGLRHRPPGRECQDDDFLVL